MCGNGSPMGDARQASDRHAKPPSDQGLGRAVALGTGPARAAVGAGTPRQPKAVTAALKAPMPPRRLRPLDGCATPSRACMGGLADVGSLAQERTRAGRRDSRLQAEKGGCPPPAAKDRRGERERESKREEASKAASHAIKCGRSDQAGWCFWVRGARKGRGGT